MLRGDKVGLRARRTSDLPVLQADLYDDVDLYSRAGSRPWHPVPTDADHPPFAVHHLPDTVAAFTVIDLTSDDIAGSAQMWGTDLHHRSAHLGLSLRPSSQGRGLATDALHVLVRYAFVTRGLHRLALETVADNEPMIRAARTAGFTHEGTLRQAVWANGTFHDELVFGLVNDHTATPDAPTRTRDPAL